MSAKLNVKSLEKLVKGFSNHRRIQMMELLERVRKFGVGLLRAPQEPARGAAWRALTFFCNARLPS
mgnify:CR=1 FL=1